MPSNRSLKKPQPRTASRTQGRTGSRTQGRTGSRKGSRSRSRSSSSSSSNSSSRSSRRTSSTSYVLPEPYSTRMFNYKNRRKTLKNNRGEVCKAQDFQVNDKDDGYRLDSDGSIYTNDSQSQLVYGNIIDDTGRVLYSLPEPTGPYSKTSDHKFIMVQLNLDDFAGSFTVGSANTGWEADIAPEIPNGSEAFLLNRQDGSDKRAYFKNSITTIVHHFIEKRMDAFFIQETNDRPRVSIADRTKVTLNSDDKFEGGYQSIIEALASEMRVPIIKEDTTYTPTAESYYSRGSFGDYSYVAFSVKVVIAVSIVEQSATYPTILTIWNHIRLGKFVAFYGEDMGKLFSGVDSTIEPKNYGRPILCVHTEYGVNLVNIQAPNEPNLVKLKLYSAIKMFLARAQIEIEVMAAAKKIKVIWNPKLIVLGGDFNDAKKSMRQITINDYLGKSQACLHYIDEAPFTCCTETPYNTLNNHPFGGDYILAKNPTGPITILDEYFRY
jgi:hypothetical protein|uniref:Endonuclease/exonuclease/phosphatase domain-containing protein n=1 Tax=viral metagenome TaxID=1070528 RepID=A0A6C0CBX8_9ZZZZ